MTKPTEPASTPAPAAGAADQAKSEPPAAKPTEHGGPRGPEPTRYGDWERNGRCSDF
ncbi:MAG TPA: DUF1674 domain-containing protein [Candidatus Sulfotelmatobacter sp.]|nr:DUF1674 domain-containing protein [Candidatus Sulfotelmatobacter sp.]